MRLLFLFYTENIYCLYTERFRGNFPDNFCSRRDSLCPHPPHSGSHPPPPTPIRSWMQRSVNCTSLIRRIRIASSWHCKWKNLEKGGEGAVGQKGCARATLWHTLTHTRARAHTRCCDTTHTNPHTPSHKNTQTHKHTHTHTHTKGHQSVTLPRRVRPACETFTLTLFASVCEDATVCARIANAHTRTRTHTHILHLAHTDTRTQMVGFDYAQIALVERKLVRNWNCRNVKFTCTKKMRL